MVEEEDALKALLLWTAIGCAVVIFSTLWLIDAEASPSWDIRTHTILEDRIMEIEGNITVRDGGWLDIRGSILRFNNSQPLEHIIIVGRGGRLSVSATPASGPSMIRPIDDRFPTRIEAIWADAVTVESLLMYDCGLGLVPALLIENVPGPVVRDCVLTDCPKGIIVRFCGNATIEGNTFSGAATGAAVEMIGAYDSAVSNNIMAGRRVGISASFSTGLVIDSNRIDGTTDMGLDLDNVASSTVRGNHVTPTSGWAIRAQSCELTSISGEEFRSSDAIPRSSSGILLLWSSFMRVQSCTFSDLSEGVRVQGLFGDHDECNALWDNRFDGCSVGVNMTSSGNFLTSCTFEGCSIGISIAANEYGEASVDSRLLYCHIESCLVGLTISNSRASTVEMTVLKDCEQALMAKGSTGSSFLNDSFIGCEEGAWSLDGGDATALNCTFEGNSVAFHLQGGSAGEVRQSRLTNFTDTAIMETGSSLALHNTTHPRSYSVSDDSALRVFWDVEVTVLLESRSRILAVGSLTATDVFGHIAARGQITSLPQTLAMELMEFERAKGAVDVRTPHLFNASVLGKGSEVQTVVDAFLRLALVIDDVRPLIIIQSPREGSINVTEVPMKGLVRDNGNSPCRFVIVLDGRTAYTGNGSWDLVMRIEDGAHSIEYHAQDAQGNTAIEYRDLYIDSTPPVLEMSSPPTDPYYLSGNVLLVSGTARNATGLSIDGRIVPLVGNSFSSLLELTEEGEHALLLKAWDDLGNTASLGLTIIRDTVPPLLEIDGYADPTKEPSVVIGGSTEGSGTSVTLDGSEVPVLPGGRFTLMLDLVEGPNWFRVEATDQAGNSAKEMVNIILDTRAIFEILAPANGTRVQVIDIEVVLQGEPNAQFEVNDLGWVRGDGQGHCTIDVVVTEPRYVIRITMKDQLGNLASKDVIVLFSPKTIVKESNLRFWLIILMMAIVLGILSLSILYVKMQRNNKNRNP
jgi:nitrous oxidase accessory protein NosD